MSVKPQIIDSFIKMFDHMKKMGLSGNDVIYLIQKRTSPRVKITDIRATFAAIRVFEKQIERGMIPDE